MGKKAAQSDLKDGDVVLVKQGLGIVRFRGRVPTKKGVQVGIELVGGKGTSFAFRAFFFSRDNRAFEKFRFLCNL